MYEDALEYSELILTIDNKNKKILNVKAICLAFLNRFDESV